MLGTGPDKKVSIYIAEDHSYHGPRLILQLSSIYSAAVWLWQPPFVASLGSEPTITSTP